MDEVTLLAIHDSQLHKIAEKGDVITLLTLAIQAHQAGLHWEALSFARTAAGVLEQQAKTKTLRQILGRMAARGLLRS